MAEQHHHSHDHSQGHHHDHGGHENHHGDEGDDDMTDFDREEISHYQGIIHAFASYNIYTQVWISRLERNWSKLPERHQKMLPQMPERITRMRQASKLNHLFWQRMLKYENMFQQQDLDRVPFSNTQSVSDPNIEKVQSTLRQFVREWSALGAPEREQSYKPFMDELQKRFPINDENKFKYRVLCPGSGLGRLPFEICRLGYACQGNEFSYFMLIPSNFILNRTSRVGEHVLFPFLHNTCNAVSEDDIFTSVEIPDVLPSDLPPGADFSYAAGDFVEIYSGQPDHWDAVCTCFFIDTANSIFDYIETIWNILKPGGVWINLGPLLYHYADMPGEMSIELSLDQVLDVARKMGFIIEETKRISTAYTKTPDGMLVYQYNCAWFVAVKPAERSR
eukprot:TRINITY_DN4961_c0_g1_i1.p1 TRINITY_DN4961_c0_g1~~TRINITY_DN4961_c0_g1_i1.p1  ORF type:complete len:392 (+),score=57.30 TRINITY_DN4961_c0_g1_i1:31-1206(+)